MSRAADNLVNPRRNLLLLIPNRSAYDYKKNFGENTSLTFDFGTVEAGYMLEDYSGKIATRNRVTGAITFNTDAAGGYGVTLTPRGGALAGNKNAYRDFIFQGSSSLDNIALSPPFAFVKYPFPGDFSAMSGLGAAYNATHRRLRMYELSCLQWSMQYAKLIQPYLYSACQAENLPYSIDHLQTEAVQLTDTGMDDNLLMWHSAVFRRDLQTVSLQKLITKNYDVLQNYDLEAVSNKPAEGGNVSTVEIPCFETLGGEVKNISSAGEVYLSNSEKWMICFVANWYGLQSFSPYQIFIPFGEDAPGNTCGFAVNQLNNSFDFTGVDETGVSFGVSPYEYVGRTTVYHLYADGSGHLSLYINGVLASTKTVNTGIKLQNLYSNELAFAFAGRIYERRVNVGIDVNNYSILTDYNNLRSYYPEYENVLIGSQNWTTSNAQITMTPLGTVIPEVTSSATWAALTTPAWCYYNNSKTTGQTFGKLYNWYAVKQLYDDIIAFNASVPANRKYLYAPANDSQVSILASYLGGAAIAGGKIKTKGFTYWTSPNTGATNESNFALPGSGYRSSIGLFTSIYLFCALIINKESSGLNSYYVFSSNDSITFNIYTGSKKYGFSLRLIKIL